jgi:hypothetical protein
MKCLTLCLVLLVVQPISGAQQNASGRSGYIPQNGFVPDERTAVAIAEAVLSPIYGADSIQKERPFHATLAGGVWTVMGTMPNGNDVGGVAILKLNKMDARVLYVLHGK